MKNHGQVLLHSGWATHNIGDIGHTPGTLCFFQEYAPELPVTLLLAHGNAAIESMLTKRFPNVPIVHGHLDARGVASTPELQAAFEGCDMVVQGSGMGFNRFWKSSTDWIEASIACGKQFGQFGQSFDGFAPEDETRLIELLSQASFIFCRDNQSLFYFRECGVKTQVLVWGPDGCLGIDVRDDHKANAFLAAHDLQSGEFITITLRTNTSHPDGSDNVLNPANPTAQDREQDERWAATLREVTITWVRATGMKVLLTPEVEKEIASMKRLIFDLLPPDVQEKTVPRTTFSNVDEAASVYAAARVVVSMEPHSCIIGLANGTPVLHCYSAKHGVKAWMFRDIGLPEWLLDIDALPAESLCDALMRIENDYHYAQQKARRAMEFVHRRAQETVQGVVGREDSG
jgi:polysaccharide pyruvyl transferase WcaK-like protein